MTDQNDSQADPEVLKKADAVRTTYSYDAANQLRHSQTSAGRTTFVYDAAGNQRLEQPPSGGRTTTTWSYESQPTEYQLPGGARTTLSYNADNRRVVKQDSSETVKFVWDPVADAYQSELDAADATQAVYTNPPVQYGQIISQRRGSTSHWYHPDSLGSTRALTGSSETTTDTYLYDAWGNPLSSSGTTVNLFRWVGNVGYYYATVSGLYYVRARVYQPTIARWTSVDPLFYLLAKAGSLGFVSEDPIGHSDGHNQYSLVRSRAIVAIDPLGELGVDITIVPLPADDPGQCGTKHQKRWDFRLIRGKEDQRIKDEGYIVQKVTVECELADCACGSCGQPRKTPYTYFEAWYVPKNAAGALGTRAYTDQADRTPAKLTCGMYRQMGEVRFYSIDKTGDLGRRNRAGKWPIRQWFPSGEKPGSECSTTAGILPATDQPPAFWINDPSPISAERLFELKWKCCPADDWAEMNSRPDEEVTNGVL